MGDKQIKRIVTAYTVQACNVVQISFISPRYNIDQYFAKEYPPAMAHQVFGTNETIFGYKNLKIKIVYSEASGHCLVKIFYTSKVNSYGLVADDLWAKLTPALPEDFARDYYYFGLRHRAENIVSKCFGTPKYQFFRAYGDHVFRGFVARLCSLNEPGFQEVHKRFQTLLLWYIDGANFIDLDDPNWGIIYLYTSHDDTSAVTGFCTFYKFYAYPDQIRARISQFIIFPPYRRSGVGVHFLRCVYNIIRDCIPNLKDITVEEPNEHFRMIRAINNVHTAFHSDAMSKFRVKADKNTDFEEELGAMFKFGKKECRVICEMITYLFASAQKYLGIKQHVIRTMKLRFKKEYTRSFKRCRHSLEYNRQSLSAHAVDVAFKAYKTEFLKTLSKVSSKIGSHYTIFEMD